MNELEILRASTMWAVFFLLLALEHFDGIRSARPERWKRRRDNILLLLVATLLLRSLVPVTMVGAAYWAQNNLFGIFHWTEVRLIYTFPLTIIFLDLVLFLQHRAFHWFPTLWRVHRVHHSDRDLDASSGLRFHPLEFLFSLVVKIIAVVAIGAPPIAVVFFEILLNLFSMATHANINLGLRIEKWLQFMVITPRVHWVHHQEEVHSSQRNFGFCLSVWDKLFSTYKLPPIRGEDYGDLGVEGLRQKRENLLDLLLQPFVRNAESEKYARGFSSDV